MADKEQNIVVVGCGGWGTALSRLLCKKNNNTVIMWGVDPDYVSQMQQSKENTNFLPGIQLPENLELSSDLEHCVQNSDVIVAATPTIYMREVCEKLTPYVHKDQLWVNVAKGIEEETLLTGTGIIKDVCGDGMTVAGLYGPSHAEEVARDMPTTVVAAAPEIKTATLVQDIFMTPEFRVYTNTDLVGAEIGAALKNVIAIAAGVCDGLGFGDNAKSALLTRGLAETRRLGMALGAKGATFGGLTGLGDLITTCVSPHGRNRSVGLRLGKGEKLEEILGSMHQVAEGIRTTRSVCKLAEKYNVDMPITREVYAMLFDNKSPLKSGRELMQRAPKPELDAEKGGLHNQG